MSPRSTTPSDPGSLLVTGSTVGLKRDFAEWEERKPQSDHGVGGLTLTSINRSVRVARDANRIASNAVSDGFPTRSAYSIKFSRVMGSLNISTLAGAVIVYGIWNLVCTVL